MGSNITNIHIFIGSNTPYFKNHFREKKKKSTVHTTVCVCVISITNVRFKLNLINKRVKNPPYFVVCTNDMKTPRLKM